MTDDDIARIAGTYHTWRGELEEVRKHGHALTRGRYVDPETQEDDSEPFQEKMQRLAATLREQLPEAAKLDATIVGAHPFNDTSWLRGGARHRHCLWLLDKSTLTLQA